MGTIERDHMTFKVGDIVRLKTVGPEAPGGCRKMIVARILEGMAWCDWYEGPKLLKARFPLSELEHAES
jgi:uncharacterized protein YodC (DUF2158 family)